MHTNPEGQVTLTIDISRRPVRSIKLPRAKHAPMHYSSSPCCFSNGVEFHISKPFAIRLWSTKYTFQYHPVLHDVRLWTENDNEDQNHKDCNYKMDARAENNAVDNGRQTITSRPQVDR